MKILLTLLSFAALSSAAMANTYKLKLDLKFHGKNLPTSILTVKEGERATISHKTDDTRNFLDVVTTKNMSDGKPSVFMQFNIGTIAGNGKKTILASPQIIAQENTIAKITQADKGKEILSLRVVATTLVKE